MVKIGQRNREILRVRFSSAGTPGLGFEALDLREVVQRVGEHHFATPRRLSFFQVMLLERGSASQEVDFVRYEIKPGLVAFTRPGQVQRLSTSKDSEGMLLLLEPAFLSAGEHAPDPNDIAALVPSAPAIESSFRTLVDEYSQVASDPSARDIIFHESIALFLRLRRQSRLGSPSGGESSEAKLFRRFETLLDKTFATHRSTAIMARELGCTEKTLSRACSTVAGVPPKTVIQERVALEAKRILAHSDQPVKEITQQLGFTEPTNFVKFFRRVAGELPSAFRVRAQSAIEIHSGVAGR
ncbi:MAG: helix-turn-helix domain-containing protein [Bryobacteraceae bacterium]|nr:helix-turn-helix domain-containing protein [Bryobacteraceae bacterium]